MPYIAPDDRYWIRPLVFGLAEKLDRAPSVGMLNYVITTLVFSWLKGRGVKYENINAAIGVLECAKLELYRRVAAEYEDRKRDENGEVYK